MTGWLLAVVVAVVALFALTVFRGAPYVPTKRRVLDKAFTELYPLTNKDVLVDIGCGDGIVLRTAAKYGAKAIGYELNPILYVIARLLSRHPRVQVRLADFWFSELPLDTTIVYTFGESRDIQRMYALVQKTATRLGRPLSFMSFGFSVPGKKELKYDGSFYLYKVMPLQKPKA